MKKSKNNFRANPLAYFLFCFELDASVTLLPHKALLKFFKSPEKMCQIRKRQFCGSLIKLDTFSLRPHIPHFSTLRDSEAFSVYS